MQRPTFFLSSTIYDFRDLRGALKFYLEEQGCKVLASEFNDFRKPLDEHSYRACLTAIHSADYFILLIGGRVGGWFDEQNRISITQREYREAYELHRSGRLKLFCFVRSGIWDVREDRRELAKYLEGIALSDGDKKAIANFPTKLVDDAKFVSSFIEEVGRNKETVRSIRTGSPAPTGNWINVFTHFRDLVGVLESTLFASTPIEDLTLKRLLRRELREILSQTLIKAGGAVFSPRRIVERFHRESPITLEGRKSEYTTVVAEIWDLLSAISLRVMTSDINTVVLDRAVSASTFLRFDLQADSYQETSVYEAILNLQRQIRRFKAVNNSDVMSVTVEYSPRGRGHRRSKVEIETTKLGAFLHLMDRWSNIVELCLALVKHLDGSPFVQPNLRPFSPIQGMEEHLAAERVTSEELDRFILESPI